MIKPKLNKVQKYFDDVRILILHQKLPAISGERLSLHLNVYPPDNKRRDLDNICKATLDALQFAGMFPDDYLICELSLKRCETRKNGEIEFALKAII